MAIKSAALSAGAITTTLLWASLAAAQTAPSTPAPKASPGAPAAVGQPGSSTVAVSTAAPAEPGVADLYPIEKLHLRDPFLKSAGSSGGSGGGEVEITDINIHNLVLKGILQDRAGDFALFVDPGSGSNLVLKKGLLFNKRNQAIPGISGVIKAKQKTVHLITSEKDVQTFILGEQGGP